MRMFLKNKFFKDHSLMFVSGVVTGAANYALYPIISRIVSIEEFGEIQIVMALIAQLSVAGAVVRIFIVNSLKEKQDPQSIRIFLRSANKAMLIFACGVGATLILASSWLQSSLKFESKWALFSAVGAVIFGFLFMLPLSFLQSKKNFKSVAHLQLLQGGSRLALGAFLGFLGFGSIGVLWGITIAGGLTTLFAHSRMQLKKSTLTTDSEVQTSAYSVGALKKHLGYLGLTAASMFTVIALLSLDTFIIKYYFSPEDAGLYAGIAIVARTLFFLASSVPHVMISSVKATKSVENNIKAYATSFALMSAVSIPALIIIYLRSEQVVSLMIGTAYTQYSGILFNLSLAMFGIGLINLISNYHVAVRDFIIIFPLIFGLGLTAFLAINAAHSPNSVAQAFLIGVSISVALCATWSVAWNYSATIKYRTIESK